jgi:periplasmic divalent cation tolerance protein
MSTLLVFTNLPERAAAERIADLLVEKKLAACVNVLAPCRSVYRWKGAVQREEEHPMLIKTTAERYAALEAALRAAHPYELPEIVAVPVERGLPAYLQWVAAETQA